MIGIGLYFLHCFGSGCVRYGYNDAGRPVESRDKLVKYEGSGVRQEGKGVRQDRNEGRQEGDTVQQESGGGGLSRRLGR